MTVSDIVIRLLPRAASNRILQTPLMRRLAHGAFWVLISAAVSRVFRIPVSILLARLMGPSSYGELGVVTGSVDLFSIFAGFGLGLTATKYIAEWRRRDPMRAGRILSLSTMVATISSAIFSIIFFFLAPWLAAHTLANAKLSEPLQIGALALLFSAMNGAQIGALYGFEAFKRVAALQSIVGILDMPLTLGGYFIGGLNGVLWGTACSRFVAWVLMGRALRHEARSRGIQVALKGWTKEVSVIWNFSIPAALAGIMVVPVNWICSTILVNQPDGYLQMGIFSAANQWNSALLFLPTVLGSGLLPILSERMGSRDIESSRSVLGTMMKLNCVLIVPCAIGLSVLSPLIMGWYGAGYTGAWTTLIAAVWASAILGVSTPVGDVIAASSRMWLGLLTNLGWAVVYVAGTLMLIRWGSFGLALSRLIAYAVHAVWTVAICRRLVTDRDQRRIPVNDAEPKFLVETGEPAS